MRTSATVADLDCGEETAPVVPERPLLFGLMIAPTGALANGLVQGGALAYLLSTQGMMSGRQSHLIALLGIPTWLYFIWSPITDFFVKRRTWLLIGGLAAGGLIVIAFHQPHLTSRSALVLMLASACLVQLVVSSCGGMMAGLRSEMNKKRASSFYQAGSMGFGALSAWVLVYMSSRVQQGTLGWIAGAMIGLPTLTALAAPARQELSKGNLGESLRNIAVEAHLLDVASSSLHPLYAASRGHGRCHRASAGRRSAVPCQWRLCRLDERTRRRAAPGGRSVIVCGSLMAAAANASPCERDRSCHFHEPGECLHHCHPLAWPSGSSNVLCRCDAVPVHVGNVLRLIDRCLSRIYGRRRHKREYALQPHQLARKRARSIHDPCRWMGLRSLWHARIGRH